MSLSFRPRVALLLWISSALVWRVPRPMWQTLNRVARSNNPWLYPSDDIGLKNLVSFPRSTFLDGAPTPQSPLDFLPARQKPSMDPPSPAQGMTPIAKIEIAMPIFIRNWDRDRDPDRNLKNPLRSDPDRSYTITIFWAIFFHRFMQSLVKIRKIVSMCWKIYSFYLIKQAEALGFF